MKTLLGLIVTVILYVGAAVASGIWVAIAVRAFNWALGA